MKRIQIFDTTLRDGEQSAGSRLDPSQKVKIAYALEEMGADVIEAGFPSSSPRDFQAVAAVAKAAERSTVCALTRAKAADILEAGRALSGAKRSRIHTGLGVSALHMEKKLGKTPQQVIAMAVEAVKIAGECADEVEFFGEDASRAEINFLKEITDAVIDAGACVVNIPDTTGYALPESFGKMVREIVKTAAGRAVISVHCHNDLGMATANTLAAVAAGAGQIEATINGIGERAGNAALEEVVMAMKIRSEVFQTITGINTTKFRDVSRMVSDAMGLTVAAHKPIVGTNAFAHSSGIHVDGILKDRSTYEIIDPHEVGKASNQIILTARSGRHALKWALERLGFEMGSGKLEKAYQMFIEIADQTQVVSDEEVMQIARRME